MGDKNQGLKACYDGGVCPDCQREIPESAEEGHECACGHVFWLDTSCDDGCPGGKMAMGM